MKDNLSNEASVELVKKIRSGDGVLRDAAFNELVRRYTPGVRRTLEKKIFRGLRTREGVTEIFNDSLHAFFLRILVPEGRDTPPLPLLLKIAANKLVDAYRRHTTAGRGVHREVGSPPDPAEAEGMLEAICLEGDPAAEAMKNEAAEDVRRAVDALPPRLRRVIRGKYFEGATLAELARKERTTEYRIRLMIAEASRILDSRLGPDTDAGA